MVRPLADALVSEAAIQEMDCRAWGKSEAARAGVREMPPSRKKHLGTNSALRGAMRTFPSHPSGAAEHLDVEGIDAEKAGRTRNRCAGGGILWREGN